MKTVLGAELKTPGLLLHLTSKSTSLEPPRKPQANSDRSRGVHDSILLGPPRVRFCLIVTYCPSFLLISVIRTYFFHPFVGDVKLLLLFYLYLNCVRKFRFNVIIDVLRFKSNILLIYLLFVPFLFPFLFLLRLFGLM